MKFLYFTLLTILLSTITNAQTATQTYHYLSTFNAQGVPNNVTYETVPQSLINNINASFPEGYPVPTYNPQYIADSVATEITMAAQGDVWVTFVKEGAGYKNVLGYYTYTGTPSASTPSDVTIIFPNVSAQGSGGGLNTGATVHLGNFAAGTKIGWFLIANGFTNNNTVGNGLWKLYANPSYNPEPLASQRRHNVMLNDVASGVIALGFEDIRRDYSNCDQDFNDAIFYVKSNPISAISTANLNSTTTPGSSGSGAGGGLESGLASKVATRLFMRHRNDELQLDKFEKQTDFLPNLQERGDNLDKFIPERTFEDCITKVSTPKDLVDMTNANEVLAIDFYQNADNQRIAAVLATETFGNVYEHTKVICDRLVGAQLTEIRKINIENKAFSINKLTQPNKDVEYTLAFSAYEDNGAWFIETQWGIDQFPKKAKFLNFQVWGNTPAYVQKLAIEIIAKLRSQYSNIRMADSQIQLPKVYAKSGKYQNGVLRLELQNTNKAGKTTVSGTLQRTETQTTKENWSYTFDLTGNATQTVEIPLGKVFDTGILIENNKSNEVDYMYLADGVWSYGINDGEAKIENFEVTHSNSMTNENEYRVERNVSVKGKVKKYAAIFRTLKPSGKTLDLSAYHNLSFEAKGKGTFEVVLVKKSINAWEQQFRTTIKIDENSKTIMLPFADFRSTAATKFDASDLLSVVIAAKGDNKTNSDFEISATDLRFSKANAVTQQNIKVFPNPATDVLNLEFQLQQEGSYSIEILDMNGRILNSEVKNGTKGNNHTTLNINDLSSGIYYCVFRQDNIKSCAKVIVCK